MYSVPFIWGRRYQSLMAVRKCKHRISIIMYFLVYRWFVVSQHLSNSTKNKHNANCSYIYSRDVNIHVFTITCTWWKSKFSNLDGNWYSYKVLYKILWYQISWKFNKHFPHCYVHKTSPSKSNETPTRCNTVQLLFLQHHSTCFRRKRPSPGVFKTRTVATGTCVIIAGKSSHLLIRAGTEFRPQ